MSLMDKMKQNKAVSNRGTSYEQYYKSGAWGKPAMRLAVKKGLFDAVEYKRIVGENY